MAMSGYELSLLVTVLAAAVSLVACGDPDILTDFVVPNGTDPGSLNGNFFTYQGLRNAINNSQPDFGVSKVSEKQFPALTGLGVSTALLEFPPQTLNPPHTHPRATEVLYVIEGSLQVAFVDTTNKLFQQTLFANDVFVFPKGLLHFQFNPATIRAIAYASFSSASPGTVSAPSALFGSAIDDNVLETAFKVSADIVHQLEAPFQSTPPPPAPPAGEPIPPPADSPIPVDISPPPAYSPIPVDIPPPPAYSPIPVDIPPPTASPV